MLTVRLKKGRDASLLRHHPWVFSGAIDSVEGTPEAGELVQVISHDQRVLGVGGYSPHSQIRVRLFSFSESTVDESFFRHTVSAALAKREPLLDDPQRNSYRLIFGESDHLPGLVVDKYNDFLVCQYQFAGLENWKSLLTEILAEQTRCQGIFEKSDTASRKREGLAPGEGVLWGQAPPDELVIQENGMQLEVNIQSGQKTGFYLDQADNRILTSRYCTDREVLNCFSYTGAFSISALAAGASHVTSVDSSRPALEILQRNLQRNNLDSNLHSCEEARVANLLRDWHKQNRQVDMVILDPPKFAEHKSQVMKASRAYKDLAMQAAKLIRPGGLLVSFSCSGGIDLKLFQKITADALLDARREGEVIQYLHQSSDHPIALAFPESQYLKGLVCRIVS
ncbi:MAG: class I SAM-dependent rRNA methyltransferase [Gammaproteobacteria bacterium]|nr:class I SAM-dependent rRNA methyltransferase [Gammaproteobacteria bacterium]